MIKPHKSWYQDPFYLSYSDGVSEFQENAIKALKNLKPRNKLNNGNNYNVSINDVINLISNLER